MAHVYHIYSCIFQFSHFYLHTFMKARCYFLLFCSTAVLLFRPKPSQALSLDPFILLSVAQERARQPGFSAIQNFPCLNRPLMLAQRLYVSLLVLLTLLPGRYEFLFKSQTTTITYLTTYSDFLNSNNNWLDFFQPSSRVATSSYSNLKPQ